MTGVVLPTLTGQTYAHAVVDVLWGNLRAQTASMMVQLKSALSMVDAALMNVERVANVVKDGNFNCE